MITYIQGDILEEQPYILVQGVNCQGIMGAGLAKQIKQKYPLVFTEYQKFIRQNELDVLGKIQVTNINNKYIINAFTQKFYGGKPDHRYVSYDAVDRCMQNIKIWTDKKSFK